MSKQQIVKRVAAQIKQQLDTMQEAARVSHEASTGEDAKAESKYDTRGLEASYLADAQAEQCQILTRSLHIFESLTLDDLPAGSSVEPGALVEGTLDGNICYYLLTPCAGGITIEHDGFDLTTLSPDAPLYQNLLDCNVGEKLERPPLLILEIS